MWAQYRTLRHGADDETTDTQTLYRPHTRHGMICLTDTSETTGGLPQLDWTHIQVEASDGVHWKHETVCSGTFVCETGTNLQWQHHAYKVGTVIQLFKWWRHQQGGVWHGYPLPSH